MHFQSLEQLTELKMFPYVHVYSRRKCCPLTGKKFKYYTGSHPPGIMFVFALCFLNELFIHLYSHPVFFIIFHS